MVRLEAFAQLMWNEPKVSSGNPEKRRNLTALLVYLCHMTKKWSYLGHVMKEEQKKNLTNKRLWLKLHYTDNLTYVNFMSVYRESR